MYMYMESNSNIKLFILKSNSILPGQGLSMWVCNNHISQNEFNDRRSKLHQIQNRECLDPWIQVVSRINEYKFVKSTYISSYIACNQITIIAIAIGPYRKTSFSILSFIQNVELKRGHIFHFRCFLLSRRRA